ncbi:MAG: thiol:disulfide interchange protein DsbA/DsbL [Nevskia sp.]
MKLRHALAFLLLPILASCSKSPEPAPSAPAPAVEAPAASAPAVPAAEAPTPPTPAAPATSPAAAATAPATPPPAGLTAGEDYELIADGQPFEPVAGKIEVAEFFNYACPACNAFNPYLEDWKAKLPADVHLLYVPADFRPDFQQYARAYYAAESFGLVEKTHRAVYEALHQLHTIPGEGDKPDEAKIAAFYAKFGVPADQFQQAMDGFAVNTKLAKARQFATHSRIQSTPTLVVDGRYRIKGKGWDDTLRIASLLVAQQRKR